MDSFLTEPVRRVVAFVIGNLVLPVGIGLVVDAGIGLSPVDLLIVGTADTTGWTVGTASWLIASACFVAALIARLKIRIWSLVSVFVTGLGIDATLSVVDTPGSLVAGIGMFVTGMVFVAAGAGLLVTANIGLSAPEAAGLALTRLRLSFPAARRVADVIFAGGGLALGASAGLGTVLFTVGFGSMVGFAVKTWTRVLRLDSVPSNIGTGTTTAVPATA